MLKTNSETFYSIDEPVQCIARSDGAYCRYFWDKDNRDAYYSLPCHCSMGGGVGYCPLPGPSAVAVKRTYEQLINAESNCNAGDRYNMQAQLECGIGPGETIEKFIEYRTTVEQWPYIAGGGIECLLGYTPANSYKTMIATYSGATLLALSSLLLAITNIF